MHSIQTTLSWGKNIALPVLWNFIAKIVLHMQRIRLIIPQKNKQTMICNEKSGKKITKNSHILDHRLRLTVRGSRFYRYSWIFCSQYPTFSHAFGGNMWATLCPTERICYICVKTRTLRRRTAYKVTTLNDANKWLRQV